MTGRDYDWVGKRSECSISQVFAELKQDVERDVRRRNELRKGPTYEYEFRLAASADSITVTVDGRGTTGNQPSISFIHHGHTIIVRDAQNRLLVEATLTLNSEKQCVFKVDRRERESWQFRMMALETLFF